VILGLGEHMKRREFITLLGGSAAAWPLAAVAQQPKVWRIGVLAPVPPTPAILSAFRNGMRERGYVKGKICLSTFAGRKDHSTKTRVL
jgi:hypothetical protein